MNDDIGNIHHPCVTNVTSSIGNINHPSTTTTSGCTKITGSMPFPPQRVAPAYPPVEHVNHPSHYGGDTTYEAIKVIEAWELGFCLGNTVKYISRAGKKDPTRTIEDLEKAKWYLDREIDRIKGKEDWRTI